MRPIILTIGIILIILGGYPPFSFWTVLIGLGLTLYGLFGKKGDKK